MAINFATALSIGSVTMAAIMVALVRFSVWYSEKHKDDDKKTEKEADSLNHPGFDGGSNLAENGAMNKSYKFSPEVRERAVRMVQEYRGEYPSLWAAVESIAPKIGCSAHTLLEWVRRDEVDAGTRPGRTSAEAQRIKELEREIKELRRANEILKLASTFFDQAEPDRRLKS